MMNLGGLYFDRHGRPLDLEGWVRLHVNGDSEYGPDAESYCTVACTEVGGCIVSTVWSGLDMALGRTGRPVIFESIAFGPQGEIRDMQRYCTEAEAAAGHEELVTLIRATDGVS